MSDLAPPESRVTQRRDPAAAAVDHRRRELENDQAIAARWLNGQGRAAAFLRRLIG